jgi:aquaporin Z
MISILLYNTGFPKFSHRITEMVLPLNPIAIITEFIGTFIFLFVIVATGNPWAIGATLAVLAYLGGSISGGHYNPAVSIMFLWDRGIGLPNALAYIVAQVVAGVLAVVAWKRIKA